MAVETTPLGFKAPDGNELVRNGDNAVADNARKAQELIAADRGRLSAIEAKNGQQDVRLGAVESKNTAQDGRLTAAEGATSALTTRVGAAEAKNTAQDARLSAGETRNTQQDARLTSIESKNTTQDSRLTAAENAATALTGRVAATESTNTAQDGRLSAVESKNAAQDTAITAAETSAKTYADSRDATIRAEDRALWRAEDDAHQAAAEANSRAYLDSLDVARRADPGMPGPQAPDPTYLEVVTDAAGAVTRGTLPDGTQHLPSAKIDRANLAGEVKQQIDSASYLQATVDSTGLIAEPFAVGPDGCTPMWVLERWAERMAPLIAPAIGLVPYPKIAAFGDSMTNGFLGGGPTYPIALASALGVEVQNFGIPSQTSHEIALRQGGLHLSLTVAGDSIPASGSVAVTAYAPTGTWRSGFAWSFPGTLAGIDGTLTKASDNTWSFTRTTAGTATTCPPGTLFVPATEKPYDSWIQIIWAGRNNVSNAAIVQADIDSMVANLAPLNKKFLILSVCNGQNEPAGSAGYNNVAAVNTSLQSAYPDNYVDLRAWLISSGLAAAGITATAADNTAIAEDRIPPSLMVDNLHFTGTGYTIVGTYLATVIRAKGYIQ